MAYKKEYVESKYPLQNNGLYSHLQNQLEIQNAILQFAKKLLQLETTEDIVWAITEDIFQKINFHDCIIYLKDEDSQKFVQRAAHGPKNPSPKQIKNQLSLNIGDGIVGHVAKTGEPEIIGDTRKDPRYIADDQIRLSEITVPILSNEEVIGIIDAEHPEPNYFNEQDLEYLKLVASLSAVTLKNALVKENLEKEITKRTFKLKSALESLQKSNEDLKNFAHVISHDLKQPLRTINAFITLIQRKEIELSEKSKEYFLFISEASIRMQNVINGLLHFSKVSNLDNDQQLFDLNITIKSIIEDLKYHIEETNTQIKYKAFPKIFGFEILIKQVFQNIIANAIKFRKQNVAPEIIINHKENESHHIFTITDNGIGIKKTYHKKVFDMFERLHSDKEYEGTGMGLSFCKKIVERHQGTITINSKGLNTGTSVQFSISKD